MRNLVGLSSFLLFLALCGSAALGAAAPAVKDALGPALVPKQPDVDYDVVPAKDYPNCKVSAVREGKTSGWIVTGPAGQTLRRFMDTNGDNTVDEWCYYMNGIEVYRDVDTNFNNKIDQSRWINTGGTRWGIDTNEDGRIDVWKIISPEEVSRIAVRALVSQDASQLTPLLVTKTDLKQLGISTAIETKIMEAIADPASKLKKAVAGSKLITPKTTWVRFDGSSPSVIPADQLKTKTDIMVYENVLAFVQSGNDPGGLIQIGELVRVGEVWKMTALPQPLEGQVQVSAWGAIMDPGTNPTAPSIADQTPTGIPAATQKLVEELHTLDKNAPPLPPAGGNKAIARFTESRITLLVKIRDACTTDEERLPWLKQLVDTIASPIQFGAFPDGMKQLDAMEAEFLAKQPKSPLIPYIRYRKMSAEYNLEMREAENSKRQGVMDKWLASLEDFVKKYPTADDAPDALLQMATAFEFNGKLEDARTWYKKLMAEEYKETDYAKRARGALHRLGLVGTRLKLAGDSIQENGKIDVSKLGGKTVLVLFWATWCKPCHEELPQIKALYDQHHSRGFEIVGVNLDMNRKDVQGYMAEFKLPWPQIFEQGGLESTLAREFGIISLPTMFLVDPDGKVINRSASLDDLKELLNGEKKKVTMP